MDKKASEENLQNGTETPQTVEDGQGRMVQGDPYENLAIAIVRQAAKDYLAAKRTGNRFRMEECRSFFLSPWLQALTNLDGTYLLRRLDAKAEAAAQKRHKKEKEQEQKPMEAIL